MMVRNKTDAWGVTWVPRASLLLVRVFWIGHVIPEGDIDVGVFECGASTVCVFVWCVCVCVCVCVLFM